MNLCKDCRHFGEMHGLAICQHPDAPINPVYGHFDGVCQTLRSANCFITPRCGVAGNWFDPKLTEGAEEANG